MTTAVVIAAAWIVVSFAAGLVLGRVLRGRNGQYHGGAMVIDTTGLPDGYEPPSTSLDTAGPYESSSAYTPESTARLREFVNADQPLPEDEIRGRS